MSIASPVFPSIGRAFDSDFSMQQLRSAADIGRSILQKAIMLDAGAIAAVTAYSPGSRATTTSGVRDVQPRNHDNEVGEDLTQLVRVGGRCSYVLLALMSLILLYPDVIEWAWGRLVMAAMASAIFVAIAYAVGRSRQRMIAASVFAVALLGLQWTYLATGNRLIFGVGVVIFLLFMAFAIAQLFAYLMRHGPVTADKLHAALAIYVLSAFLWAGLYTLLNHINPGSFLVNTARGGLLDFYDMLYFSFTTLTSTGYGDLTPATRRAESLVILEQIAGVFYVAVLIARLAGLYPPGADHPKEAGVPRPAGRLARQRRLPGAEPEGR